MFLEDELEYVRLKRHDNIMGWLAIIFVAALVFMFAGVMNSASATGSPSAHRTEATSAAPQSAPATTRAGAIGNDAIVMLFDDGKAATVSTNVAAIGNGDVQTLALATPEDNAGVAHASTAKLADHDIKTGALLLSLALMGGSFVMLTFGGPRGGRGGDEREDEDTINAL